LSEKALRQAMAAASSPGRLEVAARRPLVVLDGAHNPAAAEALAGSLPEAFAWDRGLIVLACSANKDVPGIVAWLGKIPAVAKLFATTHSSPRSADAEDVAGAARDAGVDVEASPLVEAALEAARAEATEGDLILVTGSLYTV